MISSSEAPYGTRFEEDHSGSGSNAAGGHTNTNTNTNTNAYMPENSDPRNQAPGGAAANTGEEEVGGGFSCRIDCARDITNVLSCLSAGSGGRKDILCLIEATPQSLLFLVTGRSKATQARLTLSADLFEEYECTPLPPREGETKEDEEDEGVRLSLSLVGLLDCLQLFGASEGASASFAYDSADALFRLSMEEAGILTTCDLQALYLDGDDDEGVLRDGGLFGVFMNSEVLCKVLLRTALLKEALQELFESSTASESVTVSVSSRGLGLASASGEDTSCEVYVSPPASAGAGTDKAEVCLSFECAVSADQPVNFEYPIGSLQLAMKALGVAKETYICVNEEGLMSVQHLVMGKAGRVDLDFVLMAVA